MGFLNFLVSTQWDFKPLEKGYDRTPVGLILLEAQVGQNHLHSQELSPTFSDSAGCSLINYLKPSSETSHQFPHLSDFVKKANRSGKGAQGRPLTGMSLTGGVGWDVPGLRGRGRFGEWAINWFLCILGPCCCFQRGSDEHCRQIWRQGSEGIRKDLFSFFLEWDERGEGEGEASKECYGKELIIFYLFQWPCLF